MADKLTCTLCGGSNFTKEAGFYYCNECQTQSQEIREHVLASAPDEDRDLSRFKIIRRIKSTPKQEDQLTSWECYNYIILGIVNELIQLGAHSSLKRTVRLLWFKYLRNIEVISDDPTALPKLGAFKSEKDAEIIYGRRAVRKRVRPRSRSHSPSSPLSESADSTVDSISWKRERAKHRRSLVAAQYDELSNTQASEDVSLHNQSLSSIRGGTPESNSQDGKFLKYNRVAVQELLKQMSKNHLKSHCRDVHCDLDCHKITYRSLSAKYTKGPDVLSRKNVYALIYLGLLINKEKIQLGDLLRFIREGNISFHYVDHFFPEEVRHRNLNIKFWNYGVTQFTHRGIRQAAAKLAQYLDVTKFILRQNLIDLCQRYCHELNLPEEVWAYTLNLISRVPPQMRLTQKSLIIPNYEGRIISLIMFVLKLFFGFDDRTEYKFSSNAQALNNTQNINRNSQENQKKMFVWKDWVHYINYRKLVLMQNHFPTKYLFDDEDVHDTHLFLDFVNNQNIKCEKEEPYMSRESDILKNLLKNLEEKQGNPEQVPHFQSSLTPFRDYINTLLETGIPQRENYLMDVLQQNFENNSLDFITKSFLYLDLLSEGKRVGIKHRGANKALEIVNIENSKLNRRVWRTHARNSVYVKLVNSQKLPSKSSPNKTVLEKNSNKKFNSQEIVRNFETQNMKAYKKQIQRMIKLKNSTLGDISMTSLESNNSLSQNQSLQDSHSSDLNDSDTRVNYLHYNPHERYWLRNRDVTQVPKEEFAEFFSSFPESFRFLLNECARITEQNSKDLFDEYTDVEIYLCYVAKYSKKNNFTKTVMDKELVNLIKRATNNW